jgi:regulator of sigma E protease
VNFILAFIIYIGWPLFTEILILPTRFARRCVDQINMLNAGFKTGDKIISVDGENKEV